MDKTREKKAAKQMASAHLDTKGKSTSSTTLSELRNKLEMTCSLEVDGDKNQGVPLIGRVINEENAFFKIDDIIDGKWKIISRIGTMHDSQVFQGYSESSKLHAIVRAAKGHNKKNTVRIEAFALRALSGKSVHFAQYYGGIPVNGLVLTITEPLGPNLSRLRNNMPSRTFGFHTSIKLAVQCIECLRDLHKYGLVHRIIGPSAFAMGNWNLSHETVMLTDLGFCRPYRHSNGAHIQFRGTVAFVGHADYASLNAHDKQDLSRRDDLWSLFYVIIELLQGTLPWHLIKSESITRAMKKVYGLNGLGANLPKEFGIYAKHVESLGFTDDPDYAMLIQSMQALEKYCNVKHEFIAWDWESQDDNVINEQYFIKQSK